MKKWNVSAIRAAKGREKLGCCTAYDSCFARLADEAKTALHNLRSMPERFPFCEDPGLRLQGYRHAPVTKYQFIVRITKHPNQVRVLHFFHETQDYLVALQMESPAP